MDHWAVIVYGNKFDWRLTDSWPYKLHEEKLDPKIVSSYFVGYSERSRDYKFYDPKSKIMFETGTVTFFECIEFGRRNQVRNFVF